MAIVKMYKATDGSLHEKQESYAKRETELKILKGLSLALLDKSACYVDDRGNSVLHVEDIPKFISDNAATIRNVLNASVVACRGAKKKTK